MRRRLLAFLLLSATAAAEPTDAGTPRPLPSLEAVEQSARTVFLALIQGDTKAVADSSAVPFVLEDQRITDANTLIDEWARNLRSRRMDLLVLYGIEVLTPEQMEAKYGKPPARLQSFPWRGAGTFIAVGNLSGHPAVAVFREVKRGQFRLIAFHD
jgi:hypothetical protein